MALAALSIAIASAVPAVAGGLFSGAGNPTIVTGPGNPINGGAGATSASSPSVLDLQKAPDPKTIPSATGGPDRYVGAEPDYNTEQREQWIQACEGQKKKSMEDFRACYQEHKKQARDRLQQKFNAVERRLKPGSMDDGRGLSEELNSDRLPEEKE